VNDNNDQVEISIALDKTRYRNLVEICKKYKEQHGTELTPREYVEPHRFGNLYMTNFLPFLMIILRLYLDHDTNNFVDQSFGI
jgi:hypothetical protein